MLRVIETRLEDEELVLVVGTEVAPHHCRGVAPALACAIDQAVAPGAGAFPSQ